MTNKNFNKNSNGEGLELIHLIPYNHCDFAWTNTREWHVWRYVENLKELLDLLKDDKTYTYCIDNYCQTAEIIQKYLSERIDEFREYVKEKRICIVNGGMDLVRPGNSGDELFIRNMVRGREKMAAFFGCPDMPVFFNADTGAGHSQLPQLLSLGGHGFYLFSRPGWPLDNDGVPGVFIWKGLDESEIITSRGSYCGMAGEYVKNKNLAEKAECFYKNDILPKLRIGQPDEVVVFIGGDDSMPLKNMFDVSTDEQDLIQYWNKNKKTKIKYSTLNEYYKALKKKELPIVEGVLDPCELSYNIPGKSIKSITRRRFEIERLLVSAEKIEVIALLAGIRTESKTDPFWDDLIQISGHAQEFLIENDYNYKIALADSLRFRINEHINLLKETIAANIQKTADIQYIIYNLHPWTVTETIPLHIATPFNLKLFTINNSEGKEIPYQIIKEYWGDKSFKGTRCNEADVVLRLELKPFSYESIMIAFGRKKEGTVSTAVDDILNVSTDRNFFVHVKDKKGFELFDENDVFGQLRFYQIEGSNDWYSYMEPLRRLDFLPREIKVNAEGPLYNEFTASGDIAGKKGNIIYKINSGSGEIAFDVQFDGLDQDGYYGFAFSCDEKPDIMAGIPFGTEKRALSADAFRYPDLGVGSEYLKLERGLTGQFWARHYVSFLYKDRRFAIFQGNCGIYYRYDQAANEIEIMLAHVKEEDKRTVPWVKDINKAFWGTDEQRFSFSLAYAEGMTNEDLHKLSLQREQPPLTVPRFSIVSGRLPPSHSFLEVAGMPVTAVYRDKEGVILRGFEANGEKGKAGIKNSGIKQALFCDLLLNTVSEEADIKNISLRPWEIKTLKLKGDRQ